MARLDIDTLRRTPAYPYVEAAHYLNVPPSTLRSWCVGQSYRHKGEARRFQPVIKLDGAPSEGLSFLNLVEAHVLTAIRRKKRVRLQNIREAISYLSESLNLERPLLDARFYTNGLDLFVEEMGRLINVSRRGQVEMRACIEAYLDRIERDDSGLPIRLFPFTRLDLEHDPASVEINPLIAFGRPVLKGKAVPTAVLADRFKAGDTLKELAEDFEVSPGDIEEAIRCELDRQKAA